MAMYNSLCISEMNQVIQTTKWPQDKPFFNTTQNDDLNNGEKAGIMTSSRTHMTMAPVADDYDDPDDMDVDILDEDSDSDEELDISEKSPFW